MRQVPDFAILGGNILGGLLCIGYSAKLLPLIDDPKQFGMCTIVLLVGLVLIAGEQVRPLRGCRSLTIY